MAMNKQVSNEEANKLPKYKTGEVQQKTWIPAYKEPRHSFYNNTADKKLQDVDNVEKRQVAHEIKAQRDTSAAPSNRYAGSRRST